ncbi:effector-associated domain EAD1-containing protein [Paraburkholderia sabiae]|uniref:Effector-associated domain EAD1-containing protein n=1 Tax=Paraburkholderia sabiae TaxID=273251 RepID=A0ABU9QRE8_9BURK|nr:effector-associated domain EAD1-containing protein [Paraburkholderia sabiae]WJZ79363.1 effector-associated domain EAD1-containing protein [Paraburkholderia sabiae]CAD6563035.1 5'-methylthioadenosine/S-adenosylhomocysteine nucleosidase [Paraburkholderia sabiae]
MATINPPSDKETDVLIVCALKDEYDAVKSVEAGLTDDGWLERSSVGGWLASFASFHAPNGITLRVCVTFGAQMGREHNQALAAVFANELRPKLIGMTGICAGRRGKVNLGDVIFADRVWSYDSGKVTVDVAGATTFQADPIFYSPPDVWVQRLRALTPTGGEWQKMRPQLPLEWQEEWALRVLAERRDPRDDTEFGKCCPDWGDVIIRLGKKELVESPLALSDSGRALVDEILLSKPIQTAAPAEYALAIGPIATGAAVQEDPGIFDKLSGSVRKVLGLDMEASAIGALAKSLSVPFIVAKGVSDCGDPLKDDRYRHFAARASAECFLDFVKGAGDLLAAPSNLARDTSPIPPSGEAPASIEIVRELASFYPDRESARALWERAGGAAYEVENLANPRDMWQRLWLNACRGARVSAAALLDTTLEDFPNNRVFKAARATQI